MLFQIKSAILRLLYLGQYTNDPDSETKKFPQILALDLLQHELAAVAKALSVAPGFTRLFALAKQSVAPKAQAGDNKNSKKPAPGVVSAMARKRGGDSRGKEFEEPNRGGTVKNPLSTFLSWVCTFGEMLALGSFMDHLERAAAVRWQGAPKVTCATNTFDGVNVAGLAAVDERDVKALIATAQESTRAETRLPVSFVLKPMPLPTDAELRKPLLPADRYDTLADCDGVRIIMPVLGQDPKLTMPGHLEARDWMEPLRAGQIRDILTRAQYGAGKTHFLRLLVAFIEELHGPGAVIIVLSMRRSLTGQLCRAFGEGNLPFVSYLDLPKTPLDTKRFPRTIWQVESLVHLEHLVACFRSSNVKFTMFVDEVTALLEHIFKPNVDQGLNTSREGNTQGAVPYPQAQQGMQVFAQLMPLAEHVFFSDNDLATAHADLHAIARPPEVFPRLVVDFKGQPFAERVEEARVCTHRAAKEEGIRKLVERVMEQNRLRLEQQHLPPDQQTWRATSVACHSIELARHIADTLIAKLELTDADAKALILLYHGESDEAEKKAAFANPIAAWLGALVMVHTGTLTVGVDFDHAHIDTAFGFFTDQTMTAAMSLQMLFRARKLLRLFLFLVQAGGTRPLVVTSVRGLQHWVTQSEQGRKLLPLFLRGDRFPRQDSLAPQRIPADLAAVASTSFLAKAWEIAAIQRLRSYADFAARLVSSLTLSGFSVQVDAEVEGTQEELQLVRAEAKAGKVSLQRDQAQLIGDHVLTAATRRDQQLSNPAGVKRGATALTVGEKMGEKGLLICQQLRVSPQLLANDGNWTLHYSKFAACYARAVLIHKHLLQPNGPPPPPDDAKDENKSAVVGFAPFVNNNQTPQKPPMVPAVMTDNEKHWHCLRVLEYLFSVKYADFKGGPVQLANVHLLAWDTLDASITEGRKAPESQRAAILRLSPAGKACLRMVCSEKSQRLDLLQRYGCSPTDLDRVLSAATHDQVFLKDVLLITKLALQHLGLEIYGEARQGSVMGKAHAAWQLRFQWMKPSDIELEGRREVKRVPKPLLEHPRAVARREDAWPGS